MNIETTIAIPLNDVFSPDFESKLDPLFTSQRKPETAAEQRGKPGLRELGMITKNRTPSARLWSAQS